jgi:glycine cleavage system protein P-like pyridoxal-binding family
VEKACKIIHDNGGQVYLDGESSILSCLAFVDTS